ncbi:MAG: hypothetical protein J0G35_18895, partial [Acidobacteriales bacterium]|nr:hypothetical protein [Terriglobales bacterium]
MAGLSIEYILIVVYAVFLGLIALVLETLARHVRSRSLKMNTAGFTYHADRDIWSCPRDQHLFPTFADSQPGKVIYQNADADAARQQQQFNSVISQGAKVIVL